MDDHQGAQGLLDHAGLWSGGAEVLCGRVAAAGAADVAAGLDDNAGIGAGAVVVAAVADLPQPIASGTRPRLSRKDKKKTPERS